MNAPYKPGLHWAYPKGKKEPSLVMVETKPGGGFAVKTMRGITERPIENYDGFLSIQEPLKDEGYLVGTSSAHTLQCYEAAYYPIYRDKNTGRSYEKSVTALFTDEDVLSACKTAVRWAMKGYRTCGEIYGYLYIGCVKLNGFQIMRPSQDGAISSGRGFGYLMEWKYDTGLYQPKNPDQELRNLLEEMKGLSPKKDWVKWGPPEDYVEEGS